MYVVRAFFTKYFMAKMYAMQIQPLICLVNQTNTVRLGGDLE